MYKKQRSSRGQSIRFLSIIAGLLAVFGFANADTLISADDIGLRQALESAGWQVETEAEGSLLIRPPVAATEAAAAESVLSTPARIKSLQLLEQKLRRLGWRVDREANGSLNLYPPGERPKRAPAQTAAMPDTAAPAIPQQLDRLLNQRGWRASRHPDGSLILIPAATDTGTQGQPISSIRACSGQPFDSFAGTDSSPPVDDWNKAKRASEAWLQASGEQGLLVGRIRKILRVFLVSIVETSRPHRLRHQIAIDVRDGHVVVLN